MIQLLLTQQCSRVAACSFSTYTAVRRHVRVCTYRYILYHAYFAPTSSNSSSSAPAASCVCCCLPYGIPGTWYTAEYFAVCCYCWTYSAYCRSCVVLVLAVGTSRAACSAVAAAWCTAHCYCCTLLAALVVATVYCLPYVCECGLLLLAIHIPERLAAACYLLWHSRPFLTKYKRFKKRDILARCHICHES